MWWWCILMQFKLLTVLFSCHSAEMCQTVFYYGGSSVNLQNNSITKKFPRQYLHATNVQWLLTLHASSQQQW